MEESKLIQLIKEKQIIMHTTYLHAGKNLRDEKVLAASEEIDHLINAIMRKQIFAHKPNSSYFPPRAHVSVCSIRG